MVLVSHFTDEKSVPQGGKVGFPKSLSWSGVDWELEPRSLQLHRRALPRSHSQSQSGAPRSPPGLVGVRQEAGAGALGC